MASVVLVVRRLRDPVVAPLAEAVRVLAELVRAWVACPRARSVVALSVPVVRDVRVARVPQEGALVVPVVHREVSVVPAVVRVAVLVVVLAAAPVAVAPAVVADALVDSVVARRRSRAHGGVRSSTSFNHSRPRRTRQVLLPFPRASSSSNAVARHRSSPRS